MPNHAKAAYTTKNLKADSSFNSHNDISRIFLMICELSI